MTYVFIYMLIGIVAGSLFWKIKGGDFEFGEFVASIIFWPMIFVGLLIWLTLFK